MPELKHTFTGGKMEKDLDERIVPNGQYREALNIGVATSEDSDVGAAQNILGNIRVTEAIRGRTEDLVTGEVGHEYVLVGNGPTGKIDNSHVAHIVDPQSDKLYRFINTTPKTSLTGVHSEGVWMDRIVEYDTTKDLSVPWQEKEFAVMIDIYKVRSFLKNTENVCVGGNKTIITLDNNENLNQIRWGMRVHCGPCGPMASHCTSYPMEPSTTVEAVNYQTGEILLDQIWKGATATNWHPPGLCIWFSGDRNLNFNPDVPITGINIIDGMLFWTDNHSEPKKIDIERCKFGSDTSNWTATTGLQGRHSPGAPKIDDFNQHTVLVVEEDLTYDCMKDETVCTPLGCTDPTACNYDPNAAQDDGSCGYYGCTDATAINYDATAMCDDGSCCYISGCTDGSACNYDPNACDDDGSCTYPGCTDATANNYDPNAGCDDGSCQHNYSCIPSGYANDGCADAYGIDYDSSLGIFDSSNHFAWQSAYTNTNTGVNVPAGTVTDDALNWIALNAASDDWSDYWYLEHRNGVSLPAGWETNGYCDWDLGGATLKKLIVSVMKISGVPIRGGSQQPANLGNPDPVEDVGSEYAFCDSNACDAPGTWAEVITWLRDYSVFDGQFSYYHPPGTGSTSIQPVPEVTLGMTYTQVADIVQAYYDFGDLIGMQDSVMTWVSIPCGSCTDYQAAPACVVDPGGPFTSVSDCQNCANCDCNI